MADSFFGIDTSLSNLNDDEGGGEPSEDEYDALNDETFGQDSDEFDWEVEHEQLAGQLESSRRHNVGIDDTANTQLEASLSQLVLDETDGAQARAFGSSVWRHDPAAFPTPTTSVPSLKNVCTVEELERQLRAKQQQTFTNQNYFQPRFPPVILQRPPGLQAPVPLPFAPQQPMNHGLNNHNQPLNNLMGQSPQMNQMGLLQNHVTQNLNQFMNNQFQNSPIGPSNMLNQLSQNLSVHQLGQSNQMLGQNTQMMGQNMNMNQTMNQLGHNLNQMGQNMLGQMVQNSNQMAQNMNKLGQNLNQMGQMGQSANAMGQNVNQMGQMNHLGQIGQNSQMGQINQLSQMGQTINQMGQNSSQMGQNMKQMGQNATQMGQSMNQLGQNSSQIGQPMNQMGQNSSQMGQMGQPGNQMMANGGQIPNMNFHMMGQPRMIAPPPGINMPRQNFSPNMGQFNPNFRAQSMPTKPDQPMNQTMMMNQQLIIKNQPQPITNSKHSPNQLNHSPQSKMNSKLPKVEPKVQKSRIYSNSNTKNMTSQNLVQFIQNTHPMLQYNNYHNANAMQNNRGNAFNQFSNPMFSQRHNGNYSSRHSLNGDDASGSDSDEYVGLMTQREKQWLINIQMLQLNTGTPYIHDFYYTVFLERQASKEKEGLKEAHKANQQNHPFYSGGVKSETAHRERERHNSARHNSTGDDAPPRAYVPTQFENSLGKLQCGSVTAPRKIIDVEVVGSEPAPGRMSRASSVASTTHPQEVPREMKRTKQLLLDIEALYLILLRLEELNDPLAISNALILKEREEKQKQLEAAIKEAVSDQQDESNLFLKNIESVQRRPKQDSPKSESIDKRQVVNLAIIQKPAPVKNLLDEDKDELVNKMFAGLLHSDRLPQMLAVRKGKSLVSRFVARVAPSHARLRALWSRVLRALPAAARRDDGSLAALAPHYRKYIQNTTGWSAILESCGLLAEALDPARTPYALTTSLTLSCVSALVEKASTLTTTPEATSSERQWSKFLKTVARALKHTTLSVARPHHRMSETKLMYHIKQLESRSTIEILQRGKAAEFADVSKTDVSEQLFKHLC